MVIGRACVGEDFTARAAKRMIVGAFQKGKLLSAVRGGVGHVRLDFVANSESILVCKERMCLNKYEMNF